MPPAEDEVLVTLAVTVSGRTLMPSSVPFEGRRLWMLETVQRSESEDDEVVALVAAARVASWLTRLKEGMMKRI